MVTDIEMKYHIDKVWELFSNGIMESVYSFGNDLVGYIDISIKFKFINNYKSFVKSDGQFIFMEIQIPERFKEKRAKRNIENQLKYVVKIFQFNNPSYQMDCKIIDELNAIKKPNIEQLIDIICNCLDSKLTHNIFLLRFFIEYDWWADREKTIERLSNWSFYNIYNEGKISWENLDPIEVNNINSILYSHSENYSIDLLKEKPIFFLQEVDKILSEVDIRYGQWSSYSSECCCCIDYSYTGTDYMDFLSNYL